MIKEYLKQGTKQSSMRLAFLFIAVLFTGILVFGSVATIIILAATKQVIDWLGYSAFITSMTAFSGVGLYFKKEQSKIENNGNNN